MALRKCEQSALLSGTPLLRNHFAQALLSFDLVSVSFLNITSIRVCVSTRLGTRPVSIDQAMETRRPTKTGDGPFLSFGLSARPSLSVDGEGWPVARRRLSRFLPCRRERLRPPISGPAGRCFRFVLGMSKPHRWRVHIHGRDSRPTSAGPTSSSSSLLQRLVLRPIRQHRASCSFPASHGTARGDLESVASLPPSGRGAATCGAAAGDRRDRSLLP